MIHHKRSDLCRQSSGRGFSWSSGEGDISSPGANANGCASLSVGVSRQFRSSRHFPWGCGGRDIILSSCGEFLAPYIESIETDSAWSFLSLSYSRRYGILFRTIPALTSSSLDVGFKSMSSGCYRNGTTAPTAPYSSLD
jgi:hypothetical protein